MKIYSDTTLAHSPVYYLVYITKNLHIHHHKKNDIKHRSSLKNPQPCMVVENGDIQIVQGVKPWVDAVKAVAENTDMAIALIKRWKDSSSTLSFEEWHIRGNSFLYN